MLIVSEARRHRHAYVLNGLVLKYRTEEVQRQGMYNVQLRYKTFDLHCKSVEERKTSGIQHNAN